MGRYNETMKIWQSGCQSRPLDAIIDGRKTIEGRLNRGKFAQYRPGDVVELRRDIRDADGVLHDGDAPEIRVKVVAVRPYASFLEMITAEGWQRVIPNAASPQDVANEYNTYYSAEDQQQHGVLAIQIQIL